MSNPTPEASVIVPIVSMIEPLTGSISMSRLCGLRAGKTALEAQSTMAPTMGTSWQPVTNSLPLASKARPSKATASWKPNSAIVAPVVWSIVRIRSPAAA